MLEELKEMPEVKQAFLVFGEWDIIAELDVDNPEALATFVIDRIRSNPKVRLTSSLIVGK